ncbi:UrcA family protein [Qipengyuania sp. GH1]|uniref:UrcA family protein n=1 Tax=Qipengyuania aestuarii TaxID=2867241 RepID=UPI001C87323C|nr:UrcA family protein [Qipengyuania aestuarii]MBX7534232.1 UrcA family protein [Qipengyuania aestuarii]
MNKTFALVAAALAIVATPAAAHTEDFTSITVKTADLNLASAAGQSRLEGRIDREIRKACRLGGRTLDMMRAEADCRADLREAATSEIEIAIGKARTERLASNGIDNQG